MSKLQRLWFREIHDIHLLSITPGVVIRHHKSCFMVPTNRRGLCHCLRGVDQKRSMMSLDILRRKHLIDSAYGAGTGDKLTLFNPKHEQSSLLVPLCSCDVVWDQKAVEPMHDKTMMIPLSVKCTVDYFCRAPPGHRHCIRMC